MPWLFRPFLLHSSPADWWLCIFFVSFLPLGDEQAVLPGAFLPVMDRFYP